MICRECGNTLLAGVTECDVCRPVLPKVPVSPTHVEATVKVETQQGGEAIGFKLVQNFFGASRTGSAFPTEADKSNRRVMLNRVRQTWVEGVLHESLWNHASFILDLKGKSDAVIRPYDIQLRRMGYSDVPIAPGTPIFEIYEKSQGELLLLGDPGSGKTTLLLEIAERLIADAENDPTLPIPIVFNLSTWREQHTRLDEWLVEQLNQDYGVHPKVGKRWVERGALLLLLDGLDEVAEIRRAVCVDAINEYRKDHELVMRPMVVCCRTQEYDGIPDLRLNHAVVLQSLTIAQVDDYLRGGGKALAGLRAVLRDEPALYRELFATPLMLHVAVMTYKDQTAAALRAKVSKEERIRRLWDAYIERMFQRKTEATPQYSTVQAITWLEWLGKYLTRKDLQNYLIEGMQPDDLYSQWQTFLVRWFMATFIAIISFPVFVGWNYPVAIAYTMLWIWLGYCRDIHLEPIRQFSLDQISLKWKSLLYRLVLVTGLGAGVILGVGTFAAKSELAVEETRKLVFGAVCGVVAGIAIKVVFAPFESIRADTVHPNEGIRHSLWTSLISAIFIVFILAISNIAWLPWEVVQVITVGGAGAAVYLGGRTVFQHYMLRLLLWASGQFPRNITAFLDWTAKRILVQRVGGGWKFVHRTLQERFAERYDARCSTANRIDSSAMPEAQSMPEQA